MNTEHLKFSDEEFVPSRFEPLPKRLNGHRLAYKGKAEHVKETKEEVAQADVAGKKWRHYKAVYAPLEEEYMKKVGEQDTDDAYAGVRGAAGSATTAAFDKTKQQVMGGLRTAGINPNSGKFSAALADVGEAQSLSSADTQGKAQTDQQSDYITGLNNIVAIGLGKSTEAQQGFSNMAQNSQNKAISDAHNAFNDNAAKTSTLGSLAGAGAYSFKKKPDAYESISNNAKWDDEG